MLVSNRMTPNPVTVAQEDLLIQARLKMEKGNFRRLPVVKNGDLVGILSDRDIQQHVGLLDRTEVRAAMHKDPLTVAPGTTVETAAQLMMKQKIGGLPVLENKRLVGIITTTDIMQAFLEIMGASEETSTRIDFVPAGETASLSEASRIIAQEGGELLSLGTYRKKWGETPVHYLRLRAGDADAIAKLLKQKGFDVLGVYAVGE
jgi:acetoin utilization protein AcuB